LPEALAEVKKAVAVLESLVKQQPEVDSHRGNLFLAQNNLAMVCAESRQFSEAEAEFHKAVSLGTLLVHEQPLVSKYQDDLAGCHTNLGKLYYETGRQDLLEAEQAEALRIDTALAQQQPEVVAYRVGLAKNHNNLAVFYVSTNRLPLAEAEYRKALDIVERLVREQPEVIEHAKMLGGYYANVGILEERSNRLAASLETFRQAIGTLEAVLKKEPQHARTKFILCMAYWERALVLAMVARYSEAVESWDRALVVSDGRDRNQLRALRADPLARTGDHAAAMAEIQAIAQDPSVHPDNFYRLAWACCAAVEVVGNDKQLSPDVRAQRAEDYAAYGVTLLTRAEAAGVFKRAEQRKRLKTDPYIDLLRTRKDFQRLLGEVDATAQRTTK
jgi:tetratricopeptide (TPR) repeat protein